MSSGMIKHTNFLIVFLLLCFVFMWAQREENVGITAIRLYTQGGDNLVMNVHTICEKEPGKSAWLFIYVLEGNSEWFLTDYFASAITDFVFWYGHPSDPQGQMEKFENKRYVIKLYSDVQVVKTKYNIQNLPAGELIDTKTGIFPDWDEIQNLKEYTYENMKMSE